MCMCVCACVCVHVEMLHTPTRDKLRAGPLSLEREVVLFSEVTNILSLWEVDRGCPLFRGNKCTIAMGSGFLCLEVVLFSEVITMGRGFQLVLCSEVVRVSTIGGFIVHVVVHVLLLLCMCLEMLLCCYETRMHCMW